MALKFKIRWERCGLAAVYEEDLGLLTACGLEMSQESEVAAKDGGGKAGCVNGNSRNPTETRGPVLQLLGSLKGISWPDHR